MADVTKINGYNIKDSTARAELADKYEKPVGGIPKTDLNSSVQASLNLADTAIQEHQSLSAYRTATAQDVIDLAMQNDIDALEGDVETLQDDVDTLEGEVGTLQTDVDALEASVGTLQTDVDTIEGKIPSQATSSNQLADKDFVNSSIATNTATFRGTSASGLTEEQFFAWANSLTKTNNDYVFWNTTDTDGNVVFKRYKYNGTTWLYEYSLNNSSFTANQWSAINSGITSSKITTYDGYASQIADKADNFVVTFRKNGSTWSCDKTYIEIYNAITNGKRVVGYDLFHVAIYPNASYVSTSTVEEGIEFTTICDKSISPLEHNYKASYLVVDMLGNVHYKESSRIITLGDEDYRTASEQNAIDATKYVKPTTGIPKSDLASGVQTSVENADNSWDLLEALGLYRDADGYICERS